MTTHSKPKILFISESVTLAHFARPFELSNTLDQEQYDIHFACARHYQAFLQGSKHTLHTLESIAPEQFKQALANGDPLYDYATLKSYVEADLALIAQVKPDLIVGDFRISLAISAKLAKVPYATISNAYWSPYATPQYPAPCLPLTRWLGVRVGSWLFAKVAPFAFKVHALAMRKLHQHYGLPKIPLDLRRVYTEADYTLYADIPSLFPLNNPPDSHFFIGPVLWSPPIKEPDWWATLPTDRPIVYVSMGSSGTQSALQKVVDTLATENLTLLVASAGATLTLPSVSNIFTSAYLDGNAAAQRADVVICNGGSLTCQQAFAYGKPVLGIAANMDQFLNMLGVTAAHAGVVLRADNLTSVQLLGAYRQLINDKQTLGSVQNLQQEVGVLLRKNLFAQFVATLLARS